MDSLLAKLRTPLKELWDNNKIFLILAGILILIVKFQDVIFDWLVNSSKKELQDATTKDAALKTQEIQANTQADALVEQAKSLDTNKPVVDENWNKK